MEMLVQVDSSGLKHSVRLCNTCQTIWAGVRHAGQPVARRAGRGCQGVQAAPVQLGGIGLGFNVARRRAVLGGKGCVDAHPVVQA